MITRARLPGRIYHLAEAANWPSIEQHGLLSTSALLDLAALPTHARDRYERRHRPAHTELSPGGIQIPDQKPMPVEALERCLVGLTPFDWVSSAQPQGRLLARRGSPQSPSTDITSSYSFLRPYSPMNEAFAIASLFKK